MPVRIRSVARLVEASILTQAHRRNHVHEGRRVSVTHRVAEHGRIVRRVHAVGVDKGDPELSRLLGERRVELELDVDIGVQSLIEGHGVSMVPHHHVVLDHAQPPRLRILA